MAGSRDLTPGRNIPPVPPSAGPQARMPFDSAIKENLDRILGRVGIGVEISTLDDTATLADVIAVVNAIVARLR